MIDKNSRLVKFTGGKLLNKKILEMSKTVFFSPICISHLFFCQFPGKVDEKATQLHAIASLKVLLDATKPQGS